MFEKDYEVQRNFPVACYSSSESVNVFISEYIPSTCVKFLGFKYFLVASYVTAYKTSNF